MIGRTARLFSRLDHVIQVTVHRLRQGLRALRSATVQPQDDPADDAALSLLSPAQRRAFDRLSAFDRQHALRVRHRVVAASPGDQDLAVAALLHDLAKAGTPAVPGPVRLPHRVAHVVLRSLAPALLARLAEPTLPIDRWRSGLVLALHHADLGAHMATSLGCSPQTSWLIAHHHDPDPVTDPALRTLMAADEAG